MKNSVTQKKWEIGNEIMDSDISVMGKNKVYPLQVQKNGEGSGESAEDQLDSLVDEAKSKLRSALVSDNPVN